MIRGRLARSSLWFRMAGMPLTAVHPDGGLLDATLPDLGGGAAWKDVYRARPPLALTCRACSALMSAKMSKNQVRFFAHRAEASDCPTLGESVAHRLLKLELASAIREAGWHADLEVPGNGWRADVLATSPDGCRRIAWEAQLASSTVLDLEQRTATMAADRVEVCWITDRDTPWVTHVPSARVRWQSRDATPEDAGVEVLMVVDGHATFQAEWCKDRRDCAVGDAFGERNAPCPGHGEWRVGPALPLATFVDGVLRTTIGHHISSGPVWARESRHDGGRSLWTTKPHRQADEEQLRAAQVFERWDRLRIERRVQHEANIEALLARQKSLIRPTVDWAYQETLIYPRVDNRARVPRYAMGVPVFIDQTLWAVICPVASRITPGLARWFSSATIVVADEHERRRIANVTLLHQRFRVVAG